jgi:branched-chain amino acid transport system substrate-binding protein
VKPLKLIARHLPLLLVGCGHSSSDAIKIGSILATSSGHAQVGQAELLSMQLAIDEINGAGGVDGRPLLLVNRSDDASADDSVAAAKDLIENVKVAAILGTTNSDHTYAVTAVTIPANVVLISDDTDADPLGALDTNGTVFSTDSRGSDEGKLLAKLAFARHFTKTAIMVSTEYGTYGAEGYVDGFTAGGGTVTSSPTYAPRLPSYSALLDEVYEGAPQAIVLAGYAGDGGEIIHEYLDAHSSASTFWFFPPSLGNPDFAASVGLSNFTFQHEGIDSNDGPGADAFNNAFSAAYPTTTLEPEPGGYDDVYLLALAMVAGGRSDSETIKANLRTINDPNGMKFGPGQFKEASAALKAGMAINYEGASGSCDFDKSGIAPKSYHTWAYVNGQYTVTNHVVQP